MGFLFLFKFAENACGVAQVVLNGSISNTFDKNRYWGRRVIELGEGVGRINGDGGKSRYLFLCILFARVSTASY